MGCTRRQLVCDAVLIAGFALMGRGVRHADAAASAPFTEATESAIAFVEKMTGQRATASDRVLLRMPPSFPTGYTVPIDIAIDTPMTREDHVRSVRVYAPENPLVEVAEFHFQPDRCLPRVSSRIRLARPQDIIAVAAMSDGRLLLATANVSVASNGCE